MKKIFSILLIALLLGTTVSCNKKNATKSSELADSAAIALGNLYGNGVGSQLAMYSTFKDKAAFLRGLENTLNLDTDKTEYINGVQLGMNLQNMLRNLNEQGVQIDKAKFLKAFKAAACDADLSALDKALRRIFAGKPANMSHLLRQHILHAVAVAADEPHKGGRAEFVHGFQELIDIVAFEEYIAREKYGLAATDLFARLPLFLEVVPEIHDFFGYENTLGSLRMIRQHRLLQKPLNIVLLPCLNL